MIEQYFNEHVNVAKKCLEKNEEIIKLIGKKVVETIKRGNKVLLFGNGGSAADAQHIAAEFTGRFVKERRGLPAIALTTDTSALTAIGNDYGFERIFERQVEALAQKGDLIIGISTSGNSENVILGLRKGNEIGCTTVGLTGRSGGAMNEVCDINCIVPSTVTAHIQEMHIVIGHLICKILDEDYN